MGIVWMLAARAARLMHSGGKVKESKLLHVVESERAINNSQGIIVGSWLLRVWSIEISTVVGMCC